MTSSITTATYLLTSLTTSTTKHVTLLVLLTSLYEVVKATPSAVDDARFATKATPTTDQTTSNVLLTSRAMQRQTSQQPSEGLNPQIVIIVGVLVAIPALIIALCVLRSICKMCGRKDDGAAGGNKAMPSTAAAGFPRGRVIVPLERALESMTVTGGHAPSDVRG